MIDHIDPAFGSWLAGFVDGEGCFAAYFNPHRRDGVVVRHSAHLVFQISQRADGRPILDEIAAQLRVGSVRVGRNGRSNPLAKYAVNRIDHLANVIVPLFRRYPLRSNKARDFELFAEIVTVADETHRRCLRVGVPRSNVRYPESYWTEMARLASELRSIKRYES